MMKDKPQTRMRYLSSLPIVMLVSDMAMFALVSPSTIVMALPSIGRKAKKPIHAPWPAMKCLAFSMLSGFTCRYFSTQSSLPILPTQ